MNETSRSSSVRRRIERRVSTEILRKFQGWHGVVPAGYFANFIGAITREVYWIFSEPLRKVYNTERYERIPRPAVDDNIFDWLALLEAVADARRQFVMMALGAGWGRWLVNGALAVRELSGLPCRLIGVEAEPTHFRWMRAHFQDNGLDPDAHDLIEAAVAGRVGQAWFYVGRPSAWYGQSIIADATLDALGSGTNEIEYQGERARRVRMVILVDIAQPYERIDYLHMDIQGAELDVLAAAADTLDRKVRRVLIGTHSAKIEKGLRTLFHGLGWRCQYDYPMHSTVRIDSTAVKLGDGVQGWINPVLASSTNLADLD